MELLIYILITFGFCNIIANGNIFEPIKSIISNYSIWVFELLNCVTCLGFWVGLFLTLICGEGVLSIGYAFVLSGTNTIIDTILRKLDRK